MSNDRARDAEGVDSEVAEDAQTADIIRLVTLAPLHMPAEVAQRIDAALAREAAGR